MNLKPVTENIGREMAAASRRAMVGDAAVPLAMAIGIASHHARVAADLVRQEQRYSYPTPDHIATLAVPFLAAMAAWDNDHVKVAVEMALETWEHSFDAVQSAIESYQRADAERAAEGKSE